MNIINNNDNDNDNSNDNNNDNNNDNANRDYLSTINEYNIIYYI